MDLYKIAKETKASQDKFELWQLLELLDRRPVARILEIGVHRGGMVQTFRQVYPHAKIVGLDTDFSHLEFRGFDAIAGNSHDPKVRDEVASEFGRHQIDFLFIDGDHGYDGVIKDYEMYAYLVKPGGLIGFHDIQRDPKRVPHHTGVDCRAAFDELKKKHASIEIWNGTLGDDAPGIGVLFV